MTKFRFYYPIQVRYGDLDPQWHVNNTRFLTYLEQARLAYLIELGLFDGASFFDLGYIVGDIHIRFLAPIFIHDKVRVGLCVSHIGNKSMTIDYHIEDEDGSRVMAEAQTVMVAYDYRQQKSIPISPAWREKIGAFEGREFPLPA
ncbi:MAG: acyl-CoA thioesterase [Chloroflexi bacterium]|jgi:acyl-CoA thioester hydrolase|nr:thioesterase family protein [Anaerolineaceae bacterium]NMB91187.1 acyl-CoA thioesterase [Chloroflexota bacterium]